MIIYFDIDSTLFNTHQYRVALEAAIAKQVDLTEDDMTEVMEAYRENLESSTDFDPELYLDFLIEYQELSDSLRPALAELMYDKSRFEAAVYPDVLPCLSGLHETGHSLGIYSEAVEKWQVKKIELAGFKQFFEEDLTIVAHRKMEPEVITKLKAGAIVIDDKKQVIEQLATQSSVRPIWIRRRPQELTFEPADVESITSLDQLIDKLATEG